MDYYSLNRPRRRDGWLSWPSWFTDSGRFTHKVVTRPWPAISLAHDRESSPNRTGGLITMLRHQCNTSHSDLFEEFCCPFTAMKHMTVSIKWRATGAGILQIPLQICNSCWSSETALGQATVHGECHSASLIFTANRQEHVQPLLRSLCWLQAPEWTSSVLAGSAGVSLPPRLYTRLPGVDHYVH